MQQIGFHPKSQPNRRNQCCGSGMFISDADPNFFSHPGSEFFPYQSRIRIKECKYFKINFNQKIVSKVSEIWSWLSIPPDFLPIPDPGVKKAPDPIRNTVRNTRFIVEHRLLIGLRNYCKLCCIVRSTTRVGCASATCPPSATPSPTTTPPSSSGAPSSSLSSRPCASSSSTSSRYRQISLP